jgi:hypothetical protein
MPRHERLDFKNAIHYVRVRGREGLEIFFDSLSFRRFPLTPRPNAPHVQKFEQLLAAACTECGALLHGYCVEPNSAILVLRTAGAPLHELMRRLSSRYSRYLRAEGFVPGKAVFGARYDSKVIAPDYLAHAVRRAHRSPLASDLCKRRGEYPFSSDRAYSGEISSLPIAMREVRLALEQRGHSGSRGYREFMGQEETPYAANLLTHGSPLDSRIVGETVFVQRARNTAANPSAPPTREQFIACIARLLNKTPADIVSATHVGTLGRALVAWHALRTGAATHSQVARWFSVTGATLEQAIRHHRRVTPEPFNLTVLPELELGNDA